MTTGIQVNNSGGVARLTELDYVHKLVATGSVAITGPYTSKDVPFAGMTASDEWFIVVLGEAVAVPGNGKFTITTFAWNYFNNTNAFYSIYRR